jgi:hypothetical protein
LSPIKEAAFSTILFLRTICGTGFETSFTSSFFSADTSSVADSISAADTFSGVVNYFFNFRLCPVHDKSYTKHQSK